MSTSAITKDQVIEWLSSQSVLEIAGLVKDLETKWGVSAAAPVAVAAAPAGGAAAAAPAASAPFVLLFMSSLPTPEGARPSCPGLRTRPVKGARGAIHTELGENDPL